MCSRKKRSTCGRTYPALYLSECDDATQKFLSIRCDDDNCGRENKWWFDIVVRRNTIYKLLGWKMCLRASSHYLFRCAAQSVRHQVILQLTFYTLSSRHGWFGLFERIVVVVIIMSALRHTIRCIHYSPNLSPAVSHLTFGIWRLGPRHARTCTRHMHHKWLNNHKSAFSIFAVTIFSQMQSA